MRKKEIRKVIRVSLILLAILSACIFYLTTYKIDLQNMDEKLSQALEIEHLKVIDLYSLDDGDKNMFVYFESKTGSGIALLNKGINQRYQICDSHQSHELLSSVYFLVNTMDYTVLYGKSDQTIKNIEIEVKQKREILNVNSKIIFKVLESRQSGASVIINYVNPKKEAKLSYTSHSASSWKIFTSPLKSIALIVLTYLFTLPLSNRYNKYAIDDLNEIPKDGQRIKLFTPWG